MIYVYKINENKNKIQLSRKHIQHLFCFPILVLSSSFLTLSDFIQVVLILRKILLILVIQFSIQCFSNLVGKFFSCRSDKHGRVSTFSRFLNRTTQCRFYHNTWDFHSIAHAPKWAENCRGSDYVRFSAYHALDFVIPHLSHESTLATSIMELNMEYPSFHRCRAL